MVREKVELAGRDPVNMAVTWLTIPCRAAVGETDENRVRSQTS